MSGSMRLFVEKSVVGGRTMCANNRKQISGEIEDFDAVCKSNFDSFHDESYLTPNSPLP